MKRFFAKCNTVDMLAFCPIDENAAIAVFEPFLLYSFIELS